MLPWVFVSIAIVANVCCNMMLKQAMAAAGGGAGMALARTVLLSPWFWGGAIAGFVLLISYLMAIRTLDISVSYSIVTSAALIGISISAMIFLGEAITLPKALGVGLVIAGIALISTSQGA